MDTSSFLLMNAFILKIISILLIASPAVIDILILLHRANGPSLQSPSARVAVVSKEISAMMPLVMLKHVAYFVGMLMLLRMRQLKGMRSPLVRIFVCVASLPLFLSFPLGVVMGCAGIVVAIRLPRFHQTLKVMLALVALLLLATESARAFYDPGTQRWLNRDLIQEDSWAKSGNPYNQGGNLYAFVSNDPINTTDTFGLISRPGWRTAPRPCTSIFDLNACYTICQGFGPGWRCSSCFIVYVLSMEGTHPVVTRERHINCEKICPGNKGTEWDIG